MRELQIPLTKWRDNFIYDEHAPSGLVKIFHGKEGVYTKPVGTKKNGKNKKPDSWKINFRGETWRVHRIIWIITHGVLLEDEVIDHIDRNPFNNVLNNLRVVTQDVNSRNRCMSSNNTTGVTGVWYRSVDNSFVAEWFDLNKKRFRKQFAIRKYGYDEALSLAQEFRKKALLEISKSGKGYTDSHGDPEK